VDPDDVLAIVDDPGGSPVTKKVTMQDLLSLPMGANALDDGIAFGIILTGRDGYNTTAGLPVKWHSSGYWELASAAAGAFPARGIALATQGPGGGACDVLVKGIMRKDTWNWTVGGSIYLATSGDGYLSQSAPDGSGEGLQIIGWAYSDDEVYFDFTGVYAEIT
jgi:hypothetical protein